MRVTIAMLLLMFCVLGRIDSSARVIYVAASQPDNSGTGLSWAAAKKDINAAIDMSLPGDTLWVKYGSYWPGADSEGNAAPADSRSKTFAFRDSTTVIGGFNGTETTLSQRKPGLNASVLNGDLGLPGVDSDNAYHVLTLPETIALDGFTVTSGNAYGSAAGTGGGIWATICWQVSLTNLQVVDNIGGTGAGAIVFAHALNMSNCHFERNQALSGLGGGIYLSADTAEIDSCEFVNNTAGGAGALRLFSCGSVTVRRSLFNGNAAESGGGAINMIASKRLRMEACYIAENTALRGGGIYVDGQGIVSLENVAFFRNTAYDGALYVYRADSVLLRHTSVVYNNASYAFLLEQPRSVVVENSVFFVDSTNRTALGEISIYDNYWSITPKFFNNASNMVAGTLVAGYPTTVDLRGYTPDSVFQDANRPEGADGFFFTDDDGLQPAATSPLINAGLNIPPLVLQDLLGRPRTGLNDIGAFEFKAASVSVPATVADAGYRIYPNPGSGIFWLSGPGVPAYSVISVDGREVAHGRSNGSIDLRRQPAGQYFLHLRDEEHNTIQILKMTKQ